MDEEARPGTAAPLDELSASELLGRGDHEDAPSDEARPFEPVQPLAEATIREELQPLAELTMSEEVICQLVSQGLDRSELARVVLDLIRVEGRRPRVQEAMDRLSLSHGSRSGSAWGSGGVSQPAAPLAARFDDDVAFEPVVPTEKLTRASTAASHSRPQHCGIEPCSALAVPLLLRGTSDPIRSWRVPLSYTFVGVSLEAVVRLYLRAVRTQGLGLLNEATAAELKRAICNGDLNFVHRQLQEIVENRRWECPICFCDFDSEDTITLACDAGHQFCRHCLQRHIEAVQLPRCPAVQCSYELSEEDVIRSCGLGPRLEAFQELRLRNAILSIHGRVECPNPSCQNVVVCDLEHRARVVCECGYPPFCSRCREPYHYHIECDSVQHVRAQWLQWLEVGRQGYPGVETATAELEQQQRALRHATERYRELQADEDYKANNCRLCPKCFRIVEKLSGCDSMVCGRDYHGGNNMDGCGHSFTWVSAPRYQPRVQVASSGSVQRLSTTTMLNGANVRHFFVTCSCCGKGVCGPRLRCIHCEAFDCCLQCESQLGRTHDSGHVFEVLLESEFAINEELPVGTEVEIFGLQEGGSVLNGAVASVLRYLPTARCYQVLLPMGAGKPQIPVANVQPIVRPAVASSEGQTWAEAQEILEAALAQKDVRQHCHHGLKMGQRVQLSGNGAVGPAELADALALVRQREVVPQGPNHPLRYRVELEEGIEWACATCTLLNDPNVLRCIACNRARGVEQGRERWVQAAEVCPLLTTASEAKALFQNHWAVEQRLAAAELANAKLDWGMLGLPEQQLVQVRASFEGAWEGLARVTAAQVLDCHGAWGYTVRPYAQADTVRQREGEVLVSVNVVRPVMYLQQDPQDDAEILLQRHVTADQRLAAAKLATERFEFGTFGIQANQLVWIRACPSVPGLQEGSLARVSDTKLFVTTPGEWAYKVKAAYPQLPTNSVFQRSGNNQWRGERLVGVSMIRPMMFEKEWPQERAEELFKRHLDHKERLEPLEVANARLGFGMFGLRSNQLVYVRTAPSPLLATVVLEELQLHNCDGIYGYRVKRFIQDGISERWVENYLTVALNDTRPLLHMETDPQECAELLLQCHLAEKKSRQALDAANARLDFGTLGLRPNQLVYLRDSQGLGEGLATVVAEQLQIRSCALRTLAATGCPERSMEKVDIDRFGYRVEAFSQAGCTPLFRGGKTVAVSVTRPLLHMEAQPDACAEVLLQRHFVEKERLEAVEATNALLGFGTLGLPANQVVYVGRDEGPASYCLATLATEQIQLLTYDGACGYVVKAFVQADGVHSFRGERTVRVNSVQPLADLLQKEQMQELLRQHHLLDSRLRSAAEISAFACIPVLVECGANLSWQDNQGLTPAHVASRDRLIEPLRLLAQCRADFSIRDHRGLTPAHCTWGFYADTNPHWTSTPTHIAARGHPEALRVLCELGADISAGCRGKNREARGVIITPAHHAAGAGYAEGLRILGEFRADLTARAIFCPTSGAIPMTPAAIAQRYVHDDCLRVLIEFRADVG